MCIKRIIAFLFVLLSLVSVSWAQVGPTVEGPASTGTINVKVSWADEDRVSLQQLRVELLNGTGVYLDQAFCDDTGNAHLYYVKPGTYRIKVTGVNAVETTTSVFYVQRNEAMHSEFVSVKYKPANADKQTGSTQGSVSAAALNIPDKARQEFNKANDALEKDRLPEAKKHYERAEQIYAVYAAAWNGLGVVAMREGDAALGEQMFDKAIAADTQYAPAHVNRAKILFGKPDFKGAEAELVKAVTVEPMDVVALSLLATAQLQNHEYEAALANARKVHSLPHVGMGGAHLVAGNALEALKRPAEALQEYKLYVAETPDGPNMQAARGRIELLSRQIH